MRLELIADGRSREGGRWRWEFKGRVPGPLNRGHPKAGCFSYREAMS